MLRSLDENRDHASVSLPEYNRIELSMQSDPVLIAHTTCLQRTGTRATRCCEKHFSPAVAPQGCSPRAQGASLRLPVQVALLQPRC